MRPPKIAAAVLMGHRVHVAPPSDVVQLRRWLWDEDAGVRSLLLQPAGDSPLTGADRAPAAVLADVLGRRRG